MAKENRSWGYDRIVGALANLGYQVSDQTVGNVLRRHDIPPAPERKRTTRWAEFIRTHLAVLAGTDFFTVEVLYYVLFIRLESRKVEIAGITTRPTEQWVKQMARNVTVERCGALGDSRYLLHDHDTKYTTSFLAIIESAHVKTLNSSYYFLMPWKLVVAVLWSVASGWAGSCVTTTETPRELAAKSR